MAYFTLITRDNAQRKWGIQFGDHDRAIVVQERKDSYAGLPSNCWQIVKTATKRQYEINSVVEALNGEQIAR